ncbi:Aste57867_15635 [Aphanomyces stellatus]|uniref:Aste57867_15635 protein n=1 Tax=Aphanomyces stellatus TaxID=120398 RepID=A0A485L3J3_9STRA|nr:hypothetical protein As57867_015579 [Aphanomyces stellatus]VFT92432.1 Aste57867_15635 [Aphanomyces stellatus]
MWRYFSLTLLSCVYAGNLAPIIVRGNRMYNSQTHARFFIKGITYDYDVSDANYPKSKSIIESNLKDMIGSFNTFRLYNADPARTYDQFMAHMDSLGVYVLVSASPANLDYFGDYKFSTITKTWGPDGAQVGTQIQKDQTKTCYPALLLEYGKRLVKDFAKYDNTLGLVVANEIMQENLMAAACVKQYTADLKNWMRVHANSIRILPLAYAAADAAVVTPTGTRINEDDYHNMKLMGLLCGDAMVDGVMQSSIDLYLINEYRWCNDATFATSYQRLVALATGVPIVLALGEFGCNVPSPRTWHMVPFLFADSVASLGFTDVFSGGLAYTFGQASIDPASTYPLFVGGSSGIVGQPGTTVTTDYKNLLAQYVAAPIAKQVGEFTKETICTWVPPAPPAGSNPLLALTHSWMPACSDPRLKLVPTDKWTTNTRQGAVCNDQGAPCEVSIDGVNPTTEESICGKPIVVPSGGGTCTSNADCGSHGQCISGSVNNATCVCVGCWTGVSCSIFSQDKCNTLSNNPKAPTAIFAAVGAFLGVMLLVFGYLRVAKSKKDLELHQAETAATKIAAERERV